MFGAGSGGGVDLRVEAYFDTSMRKPGIPIHLLLPIKSGLISPLLKSSGHIFQDSYFLFLLFHGTVVGVGKIFLYHSRFFLLL